MSQQALLEAAMPKTDWKVEIETWTNEGMRPVRTKIGKASKREAEKFCDERFRYKSLYRQKATITPPSGEGRSYVYYDRINDRKKC